MNVFGLFKVPESFSVVGVVDLYYKIHKVFGIDFNSKIKAMMTLIDHFVFNFLPSSSKSITPSILDASKKLFPKPTTLQ